MIIRPATLLKFHDLSKKRKYRLLYSSGSKGKSGPKGPSREIIQVIVEFKLRNPRYGFPRIAQQINKAFGIEIDKDVVRRLLAAHYQPGSGDDGPSWLTFLGHMKDSLWSIGLFHCESILLKIHWVLVVMDQFTRHIIGFGVHAGGVDDLALFQLLNTAISTQNVRTTSAPTMIRYSCTTDGKQIFAFWIFRRSNPFPTCPYCIPSSNG